MNLILKLKPIKRSDLTEISLQLNFAVLEHYMNFLLGSAFLPQVLSFHLRH